MKHTPLNQSAQAVACLLAAIALVGCASQRPVVDPVQQARVVDQIAIAKASVQDAEAVRLAQQDVAKPYLVGKSRPIAREVSLPEPLRQNVNVTALFSRDGVDLATAARQLSDATRMVITLTPDASLSAAQFGPRLSTAAPAGPGGATNSRGAIVLPNLANSPLWRVLDEVARQSGTQWRVAGAGVEFYRTVTKVFSLAGLPSIANTTASLGRNAGQNAVFESQSKTGFSTKDQDQLTGILRVVEAMLTQGGRAQLSLENQSLVVTDTPASLEKIEEYVEKQNRAASRRVRLVVEALEVVAKDNSEAGIDWNIVYAATGGTVGQASAGSLVGAQAGSLTLGVTSGRFAGTNLVLKALNEVGTVVNRRTFPLITRSGRPVTQALRTTFNYVDSVQVTGATSSTTNAPAPSVKQAEETVGTFLTLVPIARDDGQSFLSLSFDMTSADPLVPFTVGSGSSSVTVQQKTINGTGVIQEIALRSGQTMIVGGVESILGQVNERRLASGAPMLLGGSDKSSQQKSHMVLLVTAVSEEGY